MSVKVGIIGGGAAGMIASIAAARAGAKVTVLERNDLLGKKILVTGNGKCNLTNRDQSIENYYSDDLDRLPIYLKQFNEKDVIGFFDELGLLVKERDGYVYPMCEQASSVREVLEHSMKQLGIDVVYGCWVKTIQYQEEKKQYHIKGSKMDFWFDKIIISCGGQAAPKTGSDGGGFYLAKQLQHTILPVVPGLVQLKCEENWLKDVAGVRADGRVSVIDKGDTIAAETGELQLTETGISGIPVFQISRVVNRLLLSQDRVPVQLSFFSNEDPLQFAEVMYAKRISVMKNSTAEEYFTGILNRKLMALFMKFAKIDPREPIQSCSETQIKKVFTYCCSVTVQVNGSNSFDHAQVSTGGVPISEVTECLESVKAPGVYFAGEVLDVDGKCGGYNLQWAWSSGMIAGTAAGGSVL